MGYRRTVEDRRSRVGAYVSCRQSCLHRCPYEGVSPSAHDLLIIDDFGMLRLEGQIQHDFEQIIDDRYNRKALILASQLPIKDWYNVFKSELIAEACLDRIVHKSKRFELKGESLRKKY